MNPYEILGLPNNSPMNVVKKQRTQLLFKWHPDRNHDPKAVIYFKQVNEAFELISKGYRVVAPAVKKTYSYNLNYDDLCARAERMRENIEQERLRQEHIRAQVEQEIRRIQAEIDEIKRQRRAAKEAKRRKRLATMKENVQIVCAGCLSSFVVALVLNVPAMAFISLIVAAIAIALYFLDKYVS